MTRTWGMAAGLFGILLVAGAARADVGDPQLKTDHPWYPGELSCSTFERLARTQAELYARETGRTIDTDEDKALAAWYWRNLHYFHCTEGVCNYWGTGYSKGDMFNREYWKGLFAYGYGICGETHSQWEAEINRLLGPCRGRTTGVPGHNSFEVFLTGGEYGAGRWVLLDQDTSTVVFDREGKRLISIAEIAAEYKDYTNPNFRPERQHGWRSGGLSDGDPLVYRAPTTTQYNGGYAALPPMIHLRRGESLRRYLAPGLEDGKTFVFWGVNLNVDGIPGPAMHSTWVNQPEKMYRSKGACGTPSTGPARFANAVYTYTPDFKTDAYKEGVVEESEKHVIFEFHSPYIIAATPATSSQLGIYEPGGTNGLVLRGHMTCPVAVSVDQGQTWTEAGTARDGMDLTDLVKGTYQYLVRFGAGAASLSDSGLTMRTVCQCSGSVIPHLNDGQTKVTFLASNRAAISAGPNKNQVRIVEGRLDSPSVTIELSAPRREKAVRLYVGAALASGNPPDPSIKFQVDCSTDGGTSWQSVVKDWHVVRRAPEAVDFFALSTLGGEAELKGIEGPVRVRFSTLNGRPFLRVEEHLVYQLRRQASTLVTFAWTEGGGALKTASHTYAPSEVEDSSWTVKTGQKVRTVWVEEAAK